MGVCIVFKETAVTPTLSKIIASFRHLAPDNIEAFSGNQMWDQTPDFGGLGYSTVHREVMASSSVRKGKHLWSGLGFYTLTPKALGFGI